MRILIIEDDQEIRDFLKSNLATELFAVDVAADGEQGLSLARSNDYDLIILDYVLPRLNGAQILASLRRDQNQVPVIILSVKSEFNTKKELYTLGADDYLTKPFLFQELKLKIRALLKRPPQIQSQTIKVDNLIIDLDQQTVRRGGRTIYLTRKEFMLLEYFMKNRGRVLTRGIILEHAWDINSDPFSNSLETHIASLRKKLNSGNNKNLIHTFHGRGYKFDLKKLKI
ncbi:MAG: response regulator transcription factor [Patescibacteria group bacterium]